MTARQDQHLNLENDRKDVHTNDEAGLGKIAKRFMCIYCGSLSEHIYRAIHSFPYINPTPLPIPSLSHSPTSYT